MEEKSENIMAAGYLTKAETPVFIPHPLNDGQELSSKLLHLILFLKFFDIRSSVVCLIRYASLRGEDSL